MRPFRYRFRRFDRQPVRVERFAVLILGLELLESVARLLPHCHDLKWHDVDIARVHTSDVIREAETLASDHPWKMEACDLPQRSAVARIRGGIVDDYVIPLRLSGEVSVHDLRLDPAILFRVFLEALEYWLEFLLHGRVILLFRSSRAPLKSGKLVEIKQVEDLVDGHVSNHSRSPERRGGQWVVGDDFTALPGGVAHGDIFSHRRSQKHVVAGV